MSNWRSTHRRATFKEDASRMAHYLSESDEIPFEEQIKTLGNDELLDFWEETQHLAKLAGPEDLHEDVPYNPEYERLILQELQVRSCRRELK